MTPRRWALLIWILWIVAVVILWSVVLDCSTSSPC